MKDCSKQIAIGVLVVFLALAAGVAAYYFVSKPASVELKSGTLLQQPRAIQSFSLKDQNDQPFTEQSLKGQWSLIYFGFTRCAVICPTTMGYVNKIYKQLEKKGVKNMPKVIFVSVDPKRDTPEKLSSFLSHFNPDFMGALGDEENIRKLTGDLGSLYMKVKKDNGLEDDYDIDHSSAVLLINPKGQFHALFTSPDQVEEVAGDLKAIIQ